MLRILCLALTVAAISAGPINFIDCGNKEVINIDVTGCSGDTCVLHRGDHKDINVKWRSNQDSQTLKLNVTAIILGTTFDLPGYDKNGCHYVKCPFKKGQVFEQKQNLTVPENTPIVKAQLVIKATGDHGLVACVKINLRVTN